MGCINGWVVWVTTMGCFNGWWFWLATMGCFIGWWRQLMAPVGGSCGKVVVKNFNNFVGSMDK